MQDKQLLDILKEFPTILGSSLIKADDLTVDQVTEVSNFGYDVVVNDGYITFDKRQSVNRVDLCVKYIHLDYHFQSQVNTALYEKLGGMMKINDLVAAAIERLNPIARTFEAVKAEVKSMIL